MKRFNFLTIKFKLSFVSGSIAVIWLIFGVLIYSFLERISGFDNFTARINDFTVNIIQLRKAENNFLLYEQKNSYFYNTGKSRYIDNFKIHFKLSSTILKDLNNDRIASEFNLNQKLEMILKNIDLYRSNFYNLVTNTRERGYLEYGLMGELEESAQNLESFAYNFDQTSFLNEKILILRKIEKDFLSQKDLAFRDNLYSTIETYKKFFREVRTTLNHRERMALIDYLNDYRNKFDRIVQKERRIGLNTSEGLTGQTQRLFSSIEKDVQTLVDDFKRKNNHAISATKRSLFYTILLLALSIIIILYFILQSIIFPISRIKEYINELVKGKFPDPLKFKNVDEISDMANSLNKFIENLKEKAAFSEQIGKGNLNADLEPASKDDSLGNSLLAMRNSLKRAAEDEKSRKIEDQKNTWTSQGLAKFNDILRQNTENLEDLSYDIIKNLVDFVRANQGGVFIINDDFQQDVHLELVASYAYNRRRRLVKRINFKEGIVGMCAIEKATSVVTDIPEDYLEVTSGLGLATPKYILVVPMVLNEILFGVLEIASFSDFEDYQIKFVERLAENIAASLSIIKTNIQTKRLLEKFKQQSEDLVHKEEELRQNLEELKSTQEHMEEQQEYLTMLKLAIDGSFIEAEYDPDGTIQQINEQYTNSTLYSSQEIVGMNVRDYIHQDDKVDFNAIWDNLLAGKTHQGTIRGISKNGQVRWYNATFSPMKNTIGQLIKIIYIADDITYYKNQEEKSTQITEALEEKIEELKGRLGETQ